MSLIESKASPEQLILRNDNGDAVFNSNWAMMAVLGNWAGTVTVGGWTGPATGYDTPHSLDHDVAALPLGTEKLLAFIELPGGVRTEFSGSVQLGRLTFRRSPSWARVIAFEWWLAPVMVGGRIKLRERWWYHGANGSELSGWPAGDTIEEKTFAYDIRAIGFVGGS